jgi:hypothetical protein
MAGALAALGLLLVPGAPLEASSHGGPAPGGVGDAAFWIKGDAGVQVNGSGHVEQWLDQSRSGIVTSELRAAHPTHADAVTPTADITRVGDGVNFNPAVDFSGALGRSLKGNGTPDWDTGPATVFAVAHREGVSTGAGNIGGIWTANGGFSGGSAGFGLANAGTSYGLDGSGCIPAATTSSTNQPRALRAVYTATGNAQGGATWLDGVQEAVATASCPTGAGTFIEVGGRTGGSDSATIDRRIFNGQIAEVVVFRGILPAADNDRIESYLAVKYGITLGHDYLASDGSTIVWDRTADTGSNHDVTAIGRDDASGLHQKQSRSVNPGAFVTVGHGGTIATDNASNPNAFAADRSFLVFGDDHGTTAPAEAVAGTSHTRMGRIWRVDETGTVGSVKLSIPVSALTGSEPVLIRSPDAGFDSGDTLVPLVPNGPNLEAVVDLGDGDHFTFASAPAAPGGVAGGLEYWIRPDGMTVTGARVTNWDDVHARHTDETMTNGGFAFLPDGFNFHPTASTAGSAYLQFLRQQLLSGAAAGEVFSMVQSTGAHNTNDGYPSEFGGGGSAQSWEYDWQDSQVYSGWGSTTRKVWNPLLAPAGGPARNVLDPHIYNVVSRPGEWTARFDGLTNFTTATNTPNLGSSPSTHTYIGASHHSVFKGKLSEFAVYRRDLTAGERQRVQSYFATKYGVTLGTPASPVASVASDGTTVYWDNPDHQNDIAGIGRDDASRLHQKQSASINPTNVVTIGHGSIEASNEANPNGLDTDRSFMAWGHDNGAANDWVGTGTTDTQLANYRRIPRTWKVQETGNVGPVTISVAVDNSFADIPGAIDGYHLLRDSNANGDFSDDLPVPMGDAGGGRFTVGGVDFRDGERFTIATLAAEYAVDVRVVDNITGEDGKAGAFKVRLRSRPSGPVTVRLSSSNAGEGTAPSSVTIEPDGWNDFDANVVAVSGVDDTPPVADGAVPYSILTDDVVSDDPGFDALTGADVADVAMFNLNNDPPGVNVSPAGGNTTSETGGCATVRFVLLSPPTAPVTVPLSVSNPGEETLKGVTEIVITPANWNLPQDNVVTICGMDDGLTDGDVLSHLMTGDPTSADPDYEAITADQVADVALVNLGTEGAIPAVTDSDDDTVPVRTQPTLIPPAPPRAPTVLPATATVLPATTLPVTGSDIGWLLQLAAMLMAAGVSLTGCARRRCPR